MCPCDASHCPSNSRCEYKKTNKGRIVYLFRSSFLSVSLSSVPSILCNGSGIFVCSCMVRICQREMKIRASSCALNSLLWTKSDSVHPSSQAAMSVVTVLRYRACNFYILEYFKHLASRLTTGKLFTDEDPLR